MFLSARPRGTRQPSRKVRPAQYLFLSARPRGTRLLTAPFLRCHIAFLSARPRGTRPIRCYGNPSGRDCFYPRVRVGRDLVLRYISNIIRVSIRASAWDATHRSEWKALR